MKSMRWIVSVVAIVSMGLASAQGVDDATARKSTEIFDKATKLDLMNQILPILLTKEQYREILPSIERSRQRVRETERLEAGELKKIEPKLDEALKSANDKGAVPPRELLTEVSTMIRKFSIARKIISDQNTQEVLDAFNKSANAGQKKAATNALNPKMFDSAAKPEEMKDEDKLRIFVREILLHPMAYEVMRKLSI